MKEFLLSQAVYNATFYVLIGLLVVLFLWGIVGIALELSREWREERRQDKNQRYLDKMYGRD